MWTQQNSTSPNLIGGYHLNSVGSGVVGATIGGGGHSSNVNTVSANYGTIGGGDKNTVSCLEGVVAGGQNNQAFGNQAFIGGGKDNKAGSTLKPVVRWVVATVAKRLLPVAPVMWHPATAPPSSADMSMKQWVVKRLSAAED